MGRPAHLHPTPPKQTAWDYATLAAFLFAVALVAARALMLEVVQEPFEARPGAPEAPLGCGPGPGLVLDLLAFLPLLLILARRVFDKSYALRPALSFLPLALLAAWAAASVLWSTDRFTAAVSAAHAAGAAALMFAASQLVRSWTRLRVAAALGFALLLPYIAHGVYYRTVDLPELREGWKVQRAGFFAERNWEEGSFEATQFERKILGGEMVGFHASPNTFAAVIVVSLIIAAGVAVQRLDHGDGPLAAVPYVLAALGAAWLLYYCRSKAAMLTPILGIGALLFIRATAARLTPRWKLLYTAAVLATLAVTLAVIFYARARGGLPNDSLNFRWRYWVASANMVADNPWFGTGYANFFPRYLAYRLPEAAEEIRDPHNFAVRVVAELGLVGGALLLAWLLRVTWELARPLSPASPGSPIGMWTLIATGLLALVINLVCAVDWSVENYNFTILESVKRVLFFAALVIGILFAALRSPADPRSDDRASPWILASIAIAIAAFALHNLIDFSAFEVGPMYTATFLLGSLLGARTTQPDRGGATRTRPAAITALAVASLAWLAAAVFFVSPVLEAESHAHTADRFVRSALDPRTGAFTPAAIESAVEHLDEAARLVPYNDDYLSRAARAMGYNDRLRPRIAGLLDAAVATNPANPQGYIARAKFEATQPTPNWDKITEDYTKSLKLDPNNVQLRLSWADTLRALGRTADARAQYEQALRSNSLYDPTEPKRLPTTRVTELEQLLSTLPTTAPITGPTP